MVRRMRMAWRGKRKAMPHKLDDRDARADNEWRHHEECGKPKEKEEQDRDDGS